MKIMVIVKACKESEAGEMPSTERLAAMGKYNEQLVEAGIMKDGAGLHPSSKSVRVRFSGKDRRVINGPFAETKELVAGYWLWEVKSMDEAIDWLKKCPNPMPEESEIEIRPMFEAADFDEEFTPELREEEANLEAALSMKKAAVQSYLFFGGRCDEALSVPTEADADRVFNALASGGKIDMPLVKTFWSPRYGMVTDKFGVGWMVMVPGPDPL